MLSLSKPRTKIFLDSNVWNFLFDNNIYLSEELSNSSYDIFITAEGEVETNAIPDGKFELKEFIRKTIFECNIATARYFGFASYNDQENKMYDTGGFGFGEMITYNDSDFLDEQYKKINSKLKKRPTGYYKNEGDITIANHSFSAFILTNDLKEGPLRDAHEKGGRIIYLKDFNNEKSFRKFIEEKIIDMEHIE